MVVVQLAGGPKKLVFENDSRRATFVDLERSDGVQKRVVFEDGTFRREIRVEQLCKYVTLTFPAGLRLVAVEEA